MEDVTEGEINKSFSLNKQECQKLKGRNEERPSVAEWLAAELKCATSEVQWQYPARNLTCSYGQNSGERSRPEWRGGRKL